MFTVVFMHSIILVDWWFVYYLSGLPDRSLRVWQLRVAVACGPCMRMCVPVCVC